MHSMYETLMDLPLFKGIGETQVSMLLEKTSMEFLNFKDGQKIASPEMTVKTVDFILSGHVKSVYRLQHFEIIIEEYCGKGGMPAITHLFGMDTRYGAEVVAVGKTSILRIDKGHYINTLMSDRIYLMNFANCLSAAAQTAQSFMLKQEGNAVSRMIFGLAYSIANRNIETIKIKATDQELARYCNVTEKELEDWKVQAQMQGLISAEDREITLTSGHYKNY